MTTEIIEHVWSDLSANTVSDTFNSKYSQVVKRFFGRDKALWPTYQIAGLDSLIENRRHSAELNDEHMMETLLNYSEIPAHCSDSNEPFDPIAMFAAQKTKNWEDPKAVENVISTPSDPAIHGAILATIANPNLVYSEYSGKATELERLVVRQIANLAGYDVENASGIFTQGGTFCNLYGYLLGLRKALPGSCVQGFANQSMMMMNSQAGHYSNMTNLSLLGININDQVLRIHIDENNQMDIDHAEQQMETCFKQGIVIPTILLTFGTTDTFAIDDVKAVYDIRERLCAQYKTSYKPHIHVDAAIGWALIFFNNYDFTTNPLGINAATLDGLMALNGKVKALKYADSFTVDFQKWGYVPYTSSLIMVKNGKDFESLKHDPSYFSYFEPAMQDDTHLQSTIECSRSGVGVFSAFSALQYMGLEGYQAVIANGLQNANYLRALLEQKPNCVVVSPENHGPSVTFRLYDAKCKAEATEMFRRERDAFTSEKDMENVVHAAAFHRQNFQARKGQVLNTNWIDSIARTAYNANGQCLYLPGEKAVFLNPFTSRQRIEEFVANIDQ
ncbi:pyridoxal phosphate-dependent decarboxylase family protein [Vibrio porteresiae]|uniref:Pyridoxal-dependent decarboxylase n=1 Tax=Vibrio porteresiae DSM 19223 TaxID=1123496 RepID=A0ABZ0Q9H0_9VIBR|nr:pyridoxal-dependent decarboxylase [Vibrio porteresiae]WPC73076.1 pyridoxal-dependent decarboxylase [Vibrio porteresiae DSM 19223]